VAVVALTQARSSGATTTALALARCWPRPVVLVEADPTGGDLAARYGVATSPGLVDLAATPGSHPTSLRAVTQNLGGVDVVAAPVASEVIRAALDALGPGHEWARTVEDGTDVLVDCGRFPLPPGPIPTLIEAAAVLPVLLVRPTAPAVVSLRQRLMTLPEHVRHRSVVVLVGDRPYPADEVAAAIGKPVAGMLADDPVAAAALGSAEPVRMSRSALFRSASLLAEVLSAWCDNLRNDVPVPAGESAKRWSGVSPRARFSFSQNGSS
jgi:hypothetical protein